jgi:hypothetical protein
MKNYIKFLKKVHLALWSVLIASLLFWNCEDDDIKLDKRLLGKTKIVFYPINPETGVEFTEDELNELGVDPTKEAIFSSEQAVKIKIWTQLEPLKIEITEKGKQETISVIEDEVKQEKEGFTMLWSTSLKSLAIDPGLSKKYRLNISYNDAGVDGFAHNSEFPAEYAIIHKRPITGAPFVTLRKNYKELSALPYLSVVENLEDDDAIGKVATFNGKSNMVTVSENEENLNFIHQDDFSVSFWVKTSSDVDDPSMMSDKDWGSGGNAGFVVAYTGGDWKVNIADENGNRVDANGKDINDDKWHHLAVTFDRDANMILYQDGQKVAEEDISSVGDMDSGLPLRIGQDGAGAYSEWFEGMIGNAVVSNYALSEDEVKAMAGIGSGVQLRLADKSFSLLELEGGASSYTTENGMPVAIYDGVDDFSTIRDYGKLDFRYEQDFSIAFWVNTTSTYSDPVMIGDQDWNSSNNDGLSVAFRGDNCRVAISDGEGNKADFSTSDIPFNDGKWHMILLTFDRDGNVTYYQDDRQVLTEDMSLVGNISSGNPLRIAQDGTGGYGGFFEGKIGNVIIYDYVLSAEEAVMLYSE